VSGPTAASSAACSLSSSSLRRCASQRCGGSGPAEQPLAFVGQRDSDAPAILLARPAFHEAVAFQAVDVLRHRGRADSFAGRELAEPDAGRVFDADEQCHLLGGGAERPRFAAKLAADWRSAGLRASARARVSTVSWHIVNRVNDS